MNPTQAITLCRLVKAACPQQKLDQYTPDVWADLLDDVQYADAEAAVKTLAQRQPFIAPSEIRTEVKRVRSVRLANAAQIQPPSDLDPDNDPAYRNWLRTTRRSIANGDPEPPPAELVARPMPQLEHTFRRPQ